MHVGYAQSGDFSGNKANTYDGANQILFGQLYHLRYGGKTGPNSDIVILITDLISSNCPGYHPL
jgi:hypothetical protein